MCIRDSIRLAERTQGPGTSLGAAVCFFVVAIPVEGAYILLYVLPVGSAWALRALGEPDDRDAEPAAADDPTEEAAKLSGRIIAGTVVYGLATGAVEALATSAEGGAASSLSVTFVLFVLYLSLIHIYYARIASRVRWFQWTAIMKESHFGAIP